MPDIDTVRGWQDRIMVDADGVKIGNIDAIYLDDQTGQPEWSLVNTGLFGTKSSFVPLAQASASGDQVQVPYDKQRVKDAPSRNTQHRECFNSHGPRFLGKSLANGAQSGGRRCVVPGGAEGI